MKQVTILVHRVHQYRVDFYHALKYQLEKEGVRLQLVYSKSDKIVKKDEVDIEWGIYMPIKKISLFGLELYWQPAIKYIKDTDLIIVQQANRLLFNYYLIFFRRLFGVKMAYWGHGLNMQLPKSSFANKFKKLLINRTDWWFAYTSKVKKTVVQSGFDENRVTVLNNAIDTKKLSQLYQTLNGRETTRIKNDLKLNSDNIGIFCGGIYEQKRIRFLIEATDLVKKEIQDFQLIVIGSGPDEVILKELMVSRDYIHYVGPKFHSDIVPYFKLSKVFLMPGLVGLGILDSFAMETPMITTNYPYHSPEIEYLKNDYNGVMTENDKEAYALEVIKLCQDNNRLKKLIDGCKATSPLYNNEMMVQNFKSGVIKCLDNNF